MGRDYLFIYLPAGKCNVRVKQSHTRHECLAQFLAQISNVILQSEYPVSDTSVVVGDFSRARGGPAWVRRIPQQGFTQNSVYLQNGGLTADHHSTAEVFSNSHSCSTVSGCWLMSVVLEYKRSYTQTSLPCENRNITTLNPRAAQNTTEPMTQSQQTTLSRHTHNGLA